MGLRMLGLRVIVILDYSGLQVLLVVVAAAAAGVVVAAAVLLLLAVVVVVVVVAAAAVVVLLLCHSHVVSAFSSRHCKSIYAKQFHRKRQHPVRCVICLVERLCLGGCQIMGSYYITAPII